MSNSKAIEAAALKLAKRFWSIHPAELQDMGLTREAFYAREIAAAIEAAAPLLRAEVEREIVEWVRAQFPVSGGTIAECLARGDHRKPSPPSSPSPSSSPT